jgi:predicted TIM-barrel fold metal-dependent hydrolase
MKIRILLALVALVALHIGLSGPPSYNIVNVHESIEDLNDVSKLESTMASLGMASITLQGIPGDLLRYKAGAEVDLTDVGENHDYLKQASEIFPSNFDFFCTVDPADYQWEEILTACLDAGALGVKLYTGYTYTHTYALDAPEYNAFYDAMEDAGAILSFPVNTALYQEELENVLAAHPDLSTICSHYCLSSQNLERLSYLMDTYPNLYIDTAFGFIQFAREGFQTISNNHDEFADFFAEYQDRILFGTDNVITSYEVKDEAWVSGLYQNYIDILAEGEFESHLDDGLYYEGLNLPYSVLRKVFWKNWEDLLDSR